MNKRIRQLWEDNDSITVVWPETGSPVRVSAALLEKFAELMVKETMQVVANQLPSNQYLDVADAVIKHFGVEE